MPPVFVNMMFWPGLSVLFNGDISCWKVVVEIMCGEDCWVPICYYSSYFSVEAGLLLLRSRISSLLLDILSSLAFCECRGYLVCKTDFMKPSYVLVKALILSCFS